MKPIQDIESVTIRFAGDSGDGMQVTGNQFTITTAIARNDLSTLPDFPAEIRAPAGTLYGVSGFQIQFSSEQVHTPGDAADVLVAMNPAALQAGLKYLKNNGIIIINTDAFSDRNLKMANFQENPLENGRLKGYQVFPVEMSRLTKEALETVDLSHKEKERCKNFFALGMIYWMYTRSLDPTVQWIEKKFASKPVWIEANTLALKAGRNYAEATEIFTTAYRVVKAKIEPGIYRQITGNEAIAIGLIAAGEKAGVN
ncbi:MAG: 2-oxoacid:acceptor oxidoreductase family protein, partial [Calditrichaeota bacterium]|nr:2-oxoacid:acceptor oxidoreductase family protein [Calditrichota bacterium]